MRLRTKHLNLVYHHSREHVRIRIIQIFTIFPDFQLAVTFTKLLPQIKFKNSGKVLLASNPNHMCREGVLIYTLLYYNYLLNSFGYIIQNITLYALCILTFSLFGHGDIKLSIHQWLDRSCLSRIGVFFVVTFLGILFSQESIVSIFESHFTWILFIYLSSLHNKVILDFTSKLSLRYLLHYQLYAYILSDYIYIPLDYIYK